MDAEKQKQKHASIQDVATRAGVSITTVSRVINNVEYPVSPNLRKRVLDAIDELSYLPNMSAQQLRRTFNNVIGLIVRDISDSYFGEIAKGVTEKALELGYLSFVCNTGREPMNELKYHELLWQHRVRGIILAGGGMDTPQYLEILQRQKTRSEHYGLRIVALAPQGMSLRAVTVDYTEIAETITSYLLARGHRHVALITGRKDVITCQHHLVGYKRGLERYGLKYDPRLVVYGDFTESEGYNSLMELLARKAQFTAVFAGSDTLATGVLQALYHKNIHVPGDISIMSIGDLPQSRYTTPPLTTVQIPRYSMGSSAVELIVNKEKTAETEDVVFHAVVVERSSVRDLRPPKQNGKPV
jgi:LacI family transcriptional regulator